MCRRRTQSVNPTKAEATAIVYLDLVFSRSIAMEKARAAARFATEVAPPPVVVSSIMRGRKAPMRSLLDPIAEDDREQLAYWSDPTAKAAAPPR